MTDWDELQERGVLLLRNRFSPQAIDELKRAAERLFVRAESDQAASLPEHYRFSPFSCSAVITSLLDFGVEDLRRPLTDGGLEELATAALGTGATCNLAHSWVRKRYAPSESPPRYHPNTWHQDGGLGIQFLDEHGPRPPLTRLLTCWIPLHACHNDCPALEFVCQPLNSLLHYQELPDELLHSRFPQDSFWAPSLETGDGLIFLNGTLHRTHTRPDMHRSRLSVEYRFFPPPHTA